MKSRPSMVSLVEDYLDYRRQLGFALVLWFISPHTYCLDQAAMRSNGSVAELSLLRRVARSRRVNVQANGRAMAW